MHTRNPAVPLTGLHVLLAAVLLVAIAAAVLRAVIDTPPSSAPAVAVVDDGRGPGGQGAARGT